MERWGERKQRERQEERGSGNWRSIMKWDSNHFLLLLVSLHTHTQTDKQTKSRESEGEKVDKWENFFLPCLLSLSFSPSLAAFFVSFHLYPFWIHLGFLPCSQITLQFFLAPFDLHISSIQPKRRQPEREREKEEKCNTNNEASRSWSMRQRSSETNNRRDKERERINKAV